MAALTFNSNKDIHFCQNAFGLTLVLLDSFFFWKHPALPVWPEPSSFRVQSKPFVIHLLPAIKPVNMEELNEINADVLPLRC